MHTTFTKTITREHGEYRASLDGQLVGYYRSYLAAQTALDNLVYDLLCDGLHQTDGHLAIDCPHPPQPRPGHVALSDAHELAAELSAQEGINLTEALPLARSHLARLTPEPPTEPEPTPFPRPFPPADPFPRQLTWRDRERCGYCTGPHATADCRLRKPVFVGTPETCGNCEGAHPTQRCPELWQALREGQADIVKILREVRTTMVELRARGLHSSAESLRENALCRVEAWLDPEAALIRAEQLAAQRELVRATLAERVEGGPF